MSARQGHTWANTNERAHHDPYHRLSIHPPTVGPVQRAEILRHADSTRVSNTQISTPLNSVPSLRRVQRPIVSKSSPLNSTQKYTPRKDASTDRREVLSFRSVSRKIARSPERVYALDVSDSDGEDWTPARKPLFNLGTLKARKRPDWRNSSPGHTQAPSEDESSDMDSNNIEAMSQNAQTSDEPPLELLDALERLTLTTHQLQQSKKLPFLRRNLRHSLRFHGIDIRARASSGNPRLDNNTRVTYVLDGREDVRWKTYMNGYRCPACTLFKSYADKKSLELHMSRWHDGLKTRWQTEKGGQQLVVTIPDIPESESEEEEEIDELMSSSPSRSPSPTPIPMKVNPAQPTFSRSSTAAVEFELRRSPTPEVKPQIHFLGVHNDGMRERARIVAPHTRLGIVATSPTIKTDPELEPSVTPTPGPSEAASSLASAFSSVEPSSHASTRLSPSTSATPAPPVAPRPVYYSARPSGPKPYDIFNSLSLEPYGVLAWQVIDREEDLFEVDDVRDEDKVVMACWGRWIVLNKFKFLVNYFSGIKAFVEEWWQIIHEAADFDALRVFLLMLASYDFLTGDQLCRVLKLYANLAGMDIDELDQ